VVNPLPRTTTKCGAICVATLRAGANFPRFLVAHRSSRPAKVRSSLRQLRKIGSSAARAKVNTRLLSQITLNRLGAPRKRER